MKKIATLSIKIDIDKPMELNAVMSYLNTIANDYDLHCKNELDLNKEGKEGCKLEIVKLKKGSWEIVMAVVATAAGINVMVTFVKNLVNGIKYFSPKKDSSEKDLLKDDMQKHNAKHVTNIYNLLAPSAINKGSITIKADVDGKTESEHVFSGEESIYARNNIKKYRKEMSKVESLKKQRLHWAKVDFSKSKFSGKGIIQELDENAYKVIFENDADKKYMVKYNTDLEKDWQDLLYLVDVEVTKKDGKIKSYKIIDIHPDETTKKIN